MSQSTLKDKKPWSHWHNRLHKYIQANKELIPDDSSLLLAVSGGQDSMTLLKLFLDLQRLHKWQLHIWHGDHGWHSNSTQIRKELENWCKKQSLQFTFSKGTKKETANEEAARNWRYENLIKQAKNISSKYTKYPCNYILTGHTSSDRAETLIINLARGSDLAGLSSLRKKRVLSDNIQLIRPLLSFSREDTAQFCKKMRIPIWVDPSNQNLNLTRNIIRQEIIPVLEKLHPGCSQRIASLSERLSHYQNNQKELAMLALNAIKSQDGLDRKSLIKLPITARSILLSKWIHTLMSKTISASQLEEISLKIGEEKPPGYIQLSEGWTISWDKEFVQLYPKHI